MNFFIFAEEKQKPRQFASSFFDWAKCNLPAGGFMVTLQGCQWLHPNAMLLRA